MSPESPRSDLSITPEIESDMLLIKLAMVGVAIIAMMTVARNERWPQRAGVIGTCYATAAPRSNPTGSWYACKQGIVNGFPNLEADSCNSVGIVSHQEVWRCTLPLVSLPGA